MESMPVWQAVLLGVLALLIIFLWRPGIKEALQRSQQAGDKDWAGVLVPVAVVMIFVVILIMLARG